MRPLERGGAAAASAIERLRRVHRLIEPLEVSTASLLQCREHEVLAPLLEWSGADAVLRPFVEERRPGVPADGDALESVPAPPPDAEPIPRRRRAASTVNEDRRQGDPGDSAGRRRVVQADSKAVRSGVPVNGVRRARSSGDGAMTRVNAVVTPESRRRAAAILEQFESNAFEPPPSESTPAKFLRHEWLAPAPDRIEWQGPLNREDAARRLESVFAGDERLLRAWDRVVGDVPSPQEIAAILKERRPGVPVDREEPESQRGLPRERRGGVPVDSVDGPPDSVADSLSLRLQPVVDRAWRTHSKAATVEVPASTTPGRDAASGEASPHQRGPARMSGLRRLASYGETIEGPRVLPMPAKSAGGPVEAPRQTARAELTRRDLGHEVTEIFRREALRHGIVAEEDTL